MIGMTRTNVRDTVPRRFSDGQVVRALNSAVTDILIAAKVKTSYYDIITTIDTARYEIPWTEISISEVLWDPGGIDKRLIPSTRAEIHGIGSYSTSSGIPERYFRDEPHGIEVWPKPSVADTLRVYYAMTTVYASDDGLTGTAPSDLSFRLYNRTTTYAHIVCPPAYHHIIPEGGAMYLLRSDPETLKASEYWRQVFQDDIARIKRQVRSSDPTFRIQSPYGSLRGYG